VKEDVKGVGLFRESRGEGRKGGGRVRFGLGVTGVNKKIVSALGCGLENFNLVREGEVQRGALTGNHSSAKAVSY